ncbi:MAG: AmmeMemoRadiSam system protein B [candidate division WOR-3 bacterium]
MTRQPAVAGMFYSADSVELRQSVDAMLDASGEPAPAGRVVAIQVPHAGHEYSGPTAARAFRLLKGMRGLTVVMLGPKHPDQPGRPSAPYARKAMVFDRGEWATPLGSVKIDGELAAAIIGQDSYFIRMPQAHANEHSLEVQLPFLQRVAPDARIVPIMLFFPTWDECERAGRAVAKACQGRNVVVLASSDLYHGESYRACRETDSAALELITGFEPKPLFDALRAEKVMACGGDPIVVAMLAAREFGADSALLLAQTNSNDVTGARGGYCVGYSAVAFLSSREKANELASDELDEAEKQSLLEIARATLESCVAGRELPAVKPLTARLSEQRGVFVTLHKQGQLRGCIGYIEGVKPLYQAVADMAVSASTEDPRFRPVTPAELRDIDIEITVLSPLQPIPCPDSVDVGRHGVVIRKSGRGAVFLPQVPIEQGWDRDTYLTELCRKAGLPAQAWREKDAALFVFTGQVFGEKQH